MSKSYTVTIPVTGKIVMDVEADSEEEAVDMVEEKSTIDDLEDWETHPTQATVECDEDGEDEEEDTP